MQFSSGPVAAFTLVRGQGRGAMHFLHSSLVVKAPVWEVGELRSRPPSPEGPQNHASLFMHSS